MYTIPLDVLFVVVDLVGCEFRSAIADRARDEVWKIREDKTCRVSNLSSLAPLALVSTPLRQRAHAFIFEWVYLNDPNDAQSFLALSTSDPRLPEYVSFLDISLLVAGALHMQIASPLNLQWLEWLNAESQGRLLFSRLRQVHTLVIRRWHQTRKTKALLDQFWATVSYFTGLRTLAFLNCKFKTYMEPLTWPGSDAVSGIQSLQLEDRTRLSSEILRGSDLPRQTVPNVWSSLTSLALHHHQLMGGFDIAMEVTGHIRTIQSIDLDLTRTERSIYGHNDLYCHSTYDLFMRLPEFIVKCADSLKKFTCRHVHLRMVDHPDASSPLLWGNLDLRISKAAALQNMQLCVGVDCTTNWQLYEEDSSSPNYQDLYDTICVQSLSLMTSLLPNMSNTDRLLVYLDETDTTS